MANEIKTVKLDKIEIFLTLFLLINPIFYPLRDLLGPVYNYGIILSWTIYVLFKYPYFLGEILKKRSFIVFTIFMFILGVRILLNDTSNTSSFYSPVLNIGLYIRFYFYYIVFHYFNNYVSLELKTFYLKNIILFATCTALLSLYYIYLEPQAIYFDRYFNFFAIVDFNFLYAALLLISFVLTALLSGEKNKIFHIIAFIILSLVVVLSKFATLLVLYILVIIIILLLNIFKVSKKLILLGATVLFGIIFASRNFIITFISNSDFIATLFRGNKLDNLIYILQGDLSAWNRIEKYLISFNTFSQNIAWGVDYSWYNVQTISNHVQWVDDLARYGIFGSLILLFMLFLIFYGVYTTIQNDINKNLFLIGVFIYIIIGFLNPNRYGAFDLMLFIVLPFFSQYIKKEN